MDNTLEKLKALLKNSMPDTDTEQITRDSDLLSDLGLDSLNLMLLRLHRQG